MTIKVGINGMGRIGRMIIRTIIENNNKNLKINHINNRASSEVCSSLLKYDSIHGKFNANVDFDDKHLIINKNKITFSQETDLNKVNWKKYDVDYVFECTGKFNSKYELQPHLKNGAKKVIVSAPCINADKMIGLLDIPIEELNRIAQKYYSIAVDIEVVNGIPTAQLDKEQFQLWTTCEKQNEKLRVARDFIKAVEHLSDYTKVYPLNMVNGTSGLVHFNARTQKFYPNI